MKSQCRAVGIRSDADVLSGAPQVAQVFLSVSTIAAKPHSIEFRETFQFTPRTFFCTMG